MQTHHYLKYLQDVPDWPQILHGSSPPQEEGRRILARSGQAQMRPLGHMGTGERSPRIRTPEGTGFLQKCSASNRNSVSAARK